MSSMFKKKGSLAFKPKIPSARPRPTSSSVPKNIDVESPIRPTVEASGIDGQDAYQSTEKPQDAVDQVPSSVDEAPKHIHASPRSTRQSTIEKRRDPLPVAHISPNTPDSSVINTDSPDDDAAASHLPHRKEPTGKEKPRSTYKHQNPTPPPTIQDSLIAPELRDTPSIIESRELEPLVQSTSNDETQDIPPTSARNIAARPATKSTAPRTRARRKADESAGNDVEGEDDDAELRPKKRQRRTAQDTDDTATPKQPRKRKSSTPNESSRSRRARSVTPVDAETQIVDLQKLKMTDLTKDLHIGKKFSRHDELRDRERQARLRAKLKKDDGDASRDDSEIPGTPLADQLKSTNSTPAGITMPTPTPTAAAAAAATTGPQFRIVDGQIIVDQSSLVMDRHARANAVRGEMETVEENDFTRLITSNSFMTTSKLKGPNIWTDEETELFYLGLRMFGTEFEMISKMFPNKQRRHVKLKYNREERHRPDRITATICGIKTTKINIDEYKAFTGMEFESVESIEAEHRKIQEGFEAEQKRVADEQAEIMRKKREELFAEDVEEEEVVVDESSKMKRKGKKRGRQAISYGLNGEPIMT